MRIDSIAKTTQEFDLLKSDQIFRRGRGDSLEPTIRWRGKCFYGKADFLCFYETKSFISRLII